MKTWYECKVKSLGIDEAGHEHKVNETYLIDAVSYTDAETRIYEKMEELASGEFKVVNIKSSNISEIIGEGRDFFYKVKISLITIDEELGKEKKATNYILVSAADIEQGLKNLKEGLSYLLVPYAVISIGLSPICEVFEYENKEEE